LSDDIRPGDLLLGKLRVGRLLGEGATGRVFEVDHTLTGHRRALKVLRSELSSSSEAVARFVREARVASVVESPHVVQVFDAGRLEGGQVYLLMELAAGRTLRELLVEHGRLAPAFAVELAADVADGLAAVHAAGLVHRDIKPENLIVQTDAAGRPRAKILDFGLLRATAGDAFGSLTPDGSAPGTVRYLAPETERGDADARADVYSLGVVLYAAGKATPTPLGEVRADVDESLAELVSSAMCPDVAARAPSAAALGERLRAYLNGRRRGESTLAASPLLSSRYEVIGRLGEGGMGTVYEVVHKDTRRRRALKLMHPRLLADASSRARFRSEAIVAADVDSDHIVEVLDAGVCPDSDTPFLVMELLRGEDLAARLARGPLPPDEVAVLVDQIAMALDRAHERGVVHRDLKPANVFLAQRDDGSPRAKILDFGIAKVVSAVETAGGVGTPAYMAPEQMETGAPVGAAADVHALAHVAFAALTGTSYWRAEAAQGLVTVVASVARGPIEPASARAAQVGVTLPATFDAWFSRAVAVDPSRRPATAGEAASTLRSALGLAPGRRAAPTVRVVATADVAVDGATEAAVTRERRSERGSSARFAWAVAAVVVATGGYATFRATAAPAPAATTPPPASSVPAVVVDPPPAPPSASAPSPPPAAASSSGDASRARKLPPSTSASPRSAPAGTTHRDEGLY
jgi:serine/threonine-protein kinase